MLHARRWPVVGSPQPTPQIVDKVSERAFEGRQSDLGDEIVGACIGSSADCRESRLALIEEYFELVVCRSRSHARGVAISYLSWFEHRDNMALRPPGSVPLFIIAWWTSKLLLCCVGLV